MSLAEARSQLISEYGEDQVPALITLHRYNGDGRLDFAKVSIPGLKRPRYDLKKLRLILMNAEPASAQPREAIAKVPPPTQAIDYERLADLVADRLLARLPDPKGDREVIEAVGHLHNVQRNLMNKYDALYASLRETITAMRGAGGDRDDVLNAKRDMRLSHIEQNLQRISNFIETERT